MGEIRNSGVLGARSGSIQVVQEKMEGVVGVKVMQEDDGEGKEERKETTLSVQIKRWIIFL